VVHHGDAVVSGALVAVAGAATKPVYTFNLVNGSFFSPTGYIPGFGSTMSVGPDTYRGVTIGNLESRSDRDFQVQLDEELGQTFFAGVVVEDGTGTRRVYLSEDATFSAGGSTIWYWGDGSDRAYETTDSGETRSVTFF
jgi:hypothetical protein